MHIFKFICLPPNHQKKLGLQLYLLCFQVSDLSWLSGAAKVPFLLVPKTTKGKFHMTPPASIDLIGSYPLGTCTKPRVVVDLAVTIPAVSPSLVQWLASFHSSMDVMLFLGCSSPEGRCKPEISKEAGSLPRRPGTVSHFLI